ncbi:gluconate 2-dehydrogenase subunit 3 family protein [Jeotgalicoccus halotolerans]|uniref:Gluconate 2-dehydrogenase gamma chain n=1 Tax=Jeotgalicoccus halotolerans TaxID=157227 RepID=A0A3E0B0N0_9STAP|nr:gluconate 2-dehydrogenase subunit 3 family protein [Jeotgalicoccus halotolerans]REG25527.1 gluconate 2-dehydrogenase gamma chain [Jeotgalicoccus halotolerans]
MADEKQFSRRDFLKVSGSATGGMIAGSVLGGVVTNSFLDGKNNREQSNEEDVKNDNTSADSKDYTEARMFFTRFEDFQVLEQATEMIYPEDDNGPGAIELGVPYFIDKQLAGQWGDNSNDYRQGPFTNKSVDESSLTRGQMFLLGIRRINEYSNEKYNEEFIDTEDDNKVKILQDFEKDNVEMSVIKSSIFFELLRKATFEGAYADPLYGGNRNMEGWKMKEYPGPVMSYEDMIEESEFILKEPISLTDYQQK